MDKKELMALLEKVNSEVADKIKDFVNKEDFEATEKQLTEMKESLESLNFNEIKKYMENNTEKFTEVENSVETLKTEMQKQIDEAGVAITKLQEGGAPGNVKTLKSVIAEALKHDNIKDFNEKGHVGASKGVKIDLKDVTMGGFTGDVVTPSRRGPEVAYLGPKKFDIRDILSGGTSDVDVIDHLKETGYTNNEGFLAENAATVESTVNIEQVKTTSVRLGTHIDVSKKALRNVSFLTNHLTNRFSEQLGETLTDSIINGDGTSNTVDGLFNNATTFSPGTLAASVDSCNDADTISAAICRMAEITNLNATAIMMNPKDVYGVKVTKSSTGEYVESKVMVTRINNQLFIDGVPVYSTFHVTADKYLVGDLSATAVEWYETQGITMSMSEHHDTNFIKNLVTFNFEVEGLLPIYKTFAFIKGTISTDKAALDSGS